MGQARRLAWEPEHVTSILHGNQSPFTLESQVVHHLVLEEHLEPMVVEVEEPRGQKQRWCSPCCWSQPRVKSVQGLIKTRVLELQLVSTASAPEEPEDVPAVASGLGSMAPARMAPGLAEPEAGLRLTSPCAMSPWDIPGVVSGPELEPHEPSCPGPRAPAGMPPGLAEPEAGLEPSSPCATSTPCAVREEPPTILTFPPRLVAEQLTRLCAELFTEVANSEYKAYFWHQPQKGDIEFLVPNIHQIIKQFDATANVVTSSCLGALSMTARDRARVVEFWIQVAEECLALKNFESLHAIISALQSPPVCRLGSTWGHVSWKRTRTYKQLKKRDKGLSRKQLLKELTSTMRQWQWAPYRHLDGNVQGMVPVLQLFLDDLVDKRLDHNEDNDEMIVRVLTAVPPKVTHVLGEIMIHRHVATWYDLEPEESFLSFFQAVEPLDEEQSYTLSCQLEPPRQRGLLQFFRSRNM
ncbi:ral-GDS-related protein-like [Manis javanica]|uniref:ral-GDS-related protein-like n=1 Tax=Manis javanica TaxID=9974 RepID=UPI003C6CF6C6